MKCEKYLGQVRALHNIHQKKATIGERVLGSLFPSRGTGWPGGWSQDRLEQVLHYKNWVYVAVDTILCKTAAIQPNLAYVVDAPKPGATQKASRRTPGTFGAEQFISDGGHSWLTMGAYRSKALSVIKPHEELEPLESDHPLRRLMENPNPVDTSFDLFYELGMFEELCGVSYLWVVPNQWGFPCELYVIPSHWVWPRTGGGRYVSPDHPNADRLIQYYEIRPWGGMGSAGMLKFPPNEVIMTRWKSPINKIDGYSKLSAIAQWIDSEESISKSRWSQFINQARPEFWVELGAGYEDPDDDRMTRIEAKFAAKLQGEYNYGKPVITPAGAKITPLSFSPTEMAYFESEEQIRDMILSTWRVPPAAVGIVKEMTYGSILATLSALCTFCLNPRLAMRGQNLTKHLASRWSRPNRQVRLWWDDCVPADPDQVNSDIQVDIAAYATTPNEVRALRGRKAYRVGGDDPMAQGPGGIMPLPLNTGDSLEDLAQLLAPMTEAEGSGQEEMPIDGMTPEQQEAAQEVAGTDGEPEGSTGTVGAPEPAGIEDENGKPTKSYVPGVINTYSLKDWDNWFAICGISNQWKAIKEAGLPKAALEKWAQIIELNRLDEVAVEKQRQKEFDRPSKLIELPDIRQQDHYSCGAATVMSIAQYFGIGEQSGGAPTTLEEWKKLLGTTDKDATKPEDMIRVLKAHGFTVVPKQNMTLDDLKECWLKNTPVIVFLQEWGAPLESAKADITYGHVVAVIGVDMGYVFVQDPSIDNVLEGEGADQAKGRMMIKEEEFLGVWHDEDVDGNKYIHFGIAVSPGMLPKPKSWKVKKDRPAQKIMDFKGISIAVEHPSGTVRSGKGWSVTMAHDYGYIQGVKSEADGDSVDVFVGPNPDSEKVYVVNQIKPDGSFDEHKCMLGFDSLEEAEDGYLANYTSDWKGLGSIVEMSLDEFKSWLQTGDTAQRVKAFKGLLGDGPIGTDHGGQFEQQEKWALMQVRLNGIDVNIVQDDHGWFAVAHQGGSEHKITGVLGSRSEALRAAERWAAGARKNFRKGAFSSVQTAGRWLAGKWQQLESRYGRKGALTMAAAMIATMPLPGSIPAIIAAAEAIRGIAGKSHKDWITLDPSGTHVYLDGDKVTAGPASITNRPISSLSPKKPGGPTKPSGPKNHLGSTTPKPSTKKPPKKPSEAAKPEAPKPEEATGKKFGKSQAKVDFSNAWGGTEADIDKVMGEKDGKHKLSSLVGAPDDATVIANPNPAKGNISVTTRNKSFYSYRTIGRDTDGNLFVKNDLFEVNENQQGKGIGAEVFGKQVENCIENGFAYIKCEAAREEGEFNGYYTWPRFGYDQDINLLDATTFGHPDEKKTLDKIKQDHPNAKTILDIMEAPGGREWWKEHGCTLRNAKFDLAEGSRSRKVFDAYLVARAQKGK